MRHTSCLAATFLLLACDFARAQAPKPPRAPATAEEAEAVLRSKKATFEFTLAPLAVVLDFLRKTGEVPIVADPRSIPGRDGEGPTFTLKLRDISVLNALDLLLDRAGMVREFRDGAWVLSLQGLDYGGIRTELHGIGSLVRKLADDPGEVRDLFEACRPAEEKVEIDVAPEQVNAEDLITLIRDTVATESWEQEPFRIQEVGGALLVHHTGKVHEEIRGVLASLEAELGPAVVLRVQALRVPEEALQGIVPGRPLTRVETQRLEAAASGLPQPFSEARVSAVNGWRAHLAAGRTVEFPRTRTKDGLACGSVTDGLVIDVLPLYAKGGTVPCVARVFAGRTPGETSPRPRMAFLRAETLIEAPVDGWTLLASGPAPLEEEPWREGPRLAVLLRAEPAPAAEPVLPRSRSPAEDPEVRSQVKSRNLSVSFEDTPLVEAMDTLADRSGVNMVIRPEVLSTRSEDELRVVLIARDLPVDQVLNLITDMKDLGWRTHHGVVEIVPRHLLEGSFAKRVPVHDLVGSPAPLRAYVPRFLGPKQADEARVEKEEQELASLSPLTCDALVNLIRENIAPETWDTPPNRIFYRLRHLALQNQPDVVRQATEMVDRLRADAWARVSVQGAFLDGPPRWLDALGVSGPALSPAQCEELEKAVGAGKARVQARFLAAGVLKQRFYACGGRQVIYVREWAGPEAWDTGAALDGWCVEANATNGVADGRIRVRLEATASDYVAPRNPASEAGSVAAQSYRADLDLVRGGGAILGSGSGAGGFLYVRVR